MSAQGAAPAQPPLSVERLTVRADRIVCEVVLAPDAARVTTPALAARVRAAFPDIDRHACRNEEGRTFGAVIEHTSVPHLLEHLVIDLQAHAAPPGAPPFTGTTELLDAACTRARIEVSYLDDLVALRAFKDAVGFVNANLQRADGPEG